MPEINKASSSEPINVPQKSSPKPSQASSPKTRYDSGMDMFVSDPDPKFPVYKKGEGLLESWARMLQEAPKR